MNGIVQEIHCSDPTLTLHQQPIGGCQPNGRHFWLCLVFGATVLVLHELPPTGAQSGIRSHARLTRSTTPDASAVWTSQEVTGGSLAQRASHTSQLLASSMRWPLFEDEENNGRQTPKGWQGTVLDWGSIVYTAGVAAVAYVLGRPQQRSKAYFAGAVMASPDLHQAKPSFSTDVVMVATTGAAPSNRQQAVGVGLLWYLAQQVVGLGNDVIMKFVGGDLAVAQIIFLRFAFATLTMLPFMLASGRQSFRTDRLPLHLARSLLLAGGIGLYCTGLTVAPLAVVTTLNFTIPLFTLVLSHLFLKERVGPLRWVATLAGFLGVLVVLQPAQVAFDTRWLVVLLGALMFACLDVLNKHFVSKESFWAMIFYTALFTTGILAYPAYQVWAPVTLPQLRLLAMLGAGANLLLYCLLKAFSLVDASALAPFRYTELLLSAAVGFIFFAEVPALTTLLGAAVIIPSTFFLVWQESQPVSAGSGDV